MIKLVYSVIRSNSFQTLSVFAGGNLLVAILGGLGGIIQSRWAPPEVFGEFRKYGILTGYLTIGVAIVHDALTRQYPYLIGRGEKEEALRVVAVAKGWYITLSFLFSLMFVYLTCAAFFRRDLRAAAGWAVQIIGVWSMIYGLYLGVMYRTSQDFKRLSYNNIVGTVIGFASLVFVKWFGYWGIILRNGLQLATGLWFNQKYVPVRVKSVFDRGRFLKLAKMSLPLSLPGYISTSLTTATLSVVILKYLGQADLGIYGMSLALQGMAMIVTTALSQMYYPKIMHKYGESEDFISCVKYALKPTCINLVISIGIVVVLCLIIGPFIRLLIPKYVAAVSIIRILSISIVLAAVELPFIVFISALRYRTIISLSIVRFVCCFGLIAFFQKTLPMIVWSTIIAELVYVFVGYGLIVIAPRRIVFA